MWRIALSSPLQDQDRGVSSGWFADDFTLAEIKTLELRAHSGNPWFR